MQLALFLGGLSGSAEHEGRLRAGDWLRRPAATTAVTAGRLVADLIKRWVNVPVTESRRVAARSLAETSGGDESDADRDCDVSAARPDARSMLRPQRSDSRATDVVFTFGNAAWLQRVSGSGVRVPAAHAGSP